MKEPGPPVGPGSSFLKNKECYTLGMEENKTKTWQVILGILILIAAIIWFIKMPATDTAPTPASETPGEENVYEDPTIDATQLCFIWNTEAGDKAQLSMDIRGENVIGEFLWLPAEKDSKTGIFKGTVGPVDPIEMARTVNGWWEASAEGMTNTEEIIIKFGEGNAAVGFGEMKEDASGRWVYADPTKLSFEPNMSDTDCGDEAMD